MGSVWMKTVQRLDYIDGLRGLAILMVLLFHLRQLGNDWNLEIPVLHLSLSSVFSYGHVGVNLFLLLSGFCLYWPFVKMGEAGVARPEPTLKVFALKRCRRILPPYYVALLFTLIYTFIWDKGSIPANNGHYVVNWLLMHVFMLHNLNPDYIQTIPGPFWSIGLEFQLYILFPVLVESYRRFSARSVLLTVLILCGAYRLFVDYGQYTPTGDLGYTLAFSVFGRCFEFALGMYLAKFVANWKAGEPAPITRGDLLLVLGVVSLTLIRSNGDSFPPFADDFWGFLFAALLLWASRHTTIAHRALSTKWLVFLGSISYSVYLIHIPFILFFCMLAAQHHLSAARLIALEFFVVVPILIVASYAFHLLFERPFMSTQTNSGSGRNDTPIAVTMEQPPVQISPVL